MRNDFAHRVARLMVRLAALRAPVAERERFEREWHGELADAAEREAGWNVARAAWGALADAGALRALERAGHGHGRGTMTDWIAGFGKDVGVALRAMRRAPLFTGIAVVTLALGIGGTAALYTLVDRVVLDPLPYPDSERLVRLDNQVPGVGPDQIWSLSTAQWVYFSDHARTLEQVGIYRGDGGNVITPDGPQRVGAVAVTASMMPLLGARADLGRVIAPSDDTPAANVVAMISRGFWERAFGSDPSVVGRTLTFNGEPVEVIGVLQAGVLPPGWTVRHEPELWLPLRIDRAGEFWNSHVFPGIARLAPGQTPASVEAEMARLTAGLPATFPKAYSQAFFDRYGFRTRVTPLKQEVLGDLATKLWILFGGMGLVLLIAAANVANLFLVRMEGRRREMGIRSALGAGRSALARYVLAEGMTLAFLGGALALVVGFWGVPALTSLAPDDLARVSGIGMNGSSVLFTLGVSALVGFALAAYPMAMHAGRDANGALVESGRGNSAGRARHRVRSGLVVAQVALALTLAVGSGLLVRTLGALRDKELGFEPERVIALDVYPGPEYDDGTALRGFQQAVLERVRALPGVVSAGFGQELPVAGSYGCWVQGFEDESVYARIEAAGMTNCAGMERVTPGYFDALGIPLLSGRLLDDADYDDPEVRSVVVSKAFADRFWPGQDPLGQGVIPGGGAGSTGPFHHVVGVVGDVPAASAGGKPPLSETAIAIYYARPGGNTLVVKAGVEDAASLFPAVRRAVAEVDDQVPLANLMGVEEVVDTATAQLSFVSLLLGIAAGMALLLAAVGLYGVVSYVVSRRTREIGMRMAIGAQPGQVQGMVVRESVALVVGGLALGTVLAFFATGVLRGMLVGVEATDPLVYLGAGAVLALVALLASWLPARRASRIDPLEALRAE